MVEFQEFPKMVTDPESDLPVTVDGPEQERAVLEGRAKLDRLESAEGPSLTYAGTK